MLDVSHPGPGPFGAAAAAGRHPARPRPAATRHAAGSADAVAGGLAMDRGGKWSKKRMDGPMGMVFRCFYGQTKKW